MTDRFLKFFKALIGNEGSYSDNPNDSGGKTIYGITRTSFPAQFATCYGYWKLSPAQALTYAQGFYYSNFYKPIYEQIHDEKVAFKLFDLGVNMGMVTPIKILQKAVGCVDDGVFGNNTLSMVNSKDCYQDFLIEAEKHYRAIVVSNPKDEIFLKDWLNRLARSI